MMKLCCDKVCAFTLAEAIGTAYVDPADGAEGFERLRT